MALTLTYSASTTAAFTNPGTSAAVQVTQQGNTSASTSVGGAVNVDNSLNTGAGLVVYSSQAAPTGRLIVARANNATYSQTAMYAENAGTGHAFHANQTVATPNSTGSAINATSANTGNSCAFFSGVETGRGTVKITHTGNTAVASDANAAGLSIDLQTSGVSGATAAQGIFIEATTGGTTGNLVDVRNNGNHLFKWRGVGLTRPEMEFGNGGPVITMGTGIPAITSPNGSLFIRSDGTGPNLYVRENGAWVSK